MNPIERRQIMARYVIALRQSYGVHPVTGYQIMENCFRYAETPNRAYQLARRHLDFLWPLQCIGGRQ